ncbi:MAG: TIGR03089 family protein [Nocardioides sp.]
MPVSTFTAALATQLRSDAARPLVTFYDDATGERVELSVTTYANWVAKTAGLVQDELDGDRGQLVFVDLPTHWIGAVWLGAAWSIGMCVTDDPARVGQADLVVCGPEGTEEYADLTGRMPVVAISLRPMGASFAEPLPPGVVDYGAVVLGQPDHFTADDPPTGEDLAWVGGQEPADRLTQSDLIALATASPADAGGGRLLTDVSPTTRRGLTTLLGPLLGGGGTVWVRRPDEGGWQRRYDAERATSTLRATTGPGHPTRS